MARKGVRLVLLCEDDEHRRFAWRVFRELGPHYRELRVAPSPCGRGSAEKWVRENYAKEVRAHRRRASSQQNTGLVVVIDADKLTVTTRHSQLAKNLEEEGLKPRSRDERIAIWVPRRHIETWVAYLQGKDVSEDDDCRKHAPLEGYRPAARRFVELYRGPSSRPVDLLPSLVTAFEESARVDR